MVASVFVCVVCTGRECVVANPLLLHILVYTPQLQPESGSQILIPTPLSLTARGGSFLYQTQHRPPVILVRIQVYYQRRVPRIQVHCNNRVPRTQAYDKNRVPRIQVYCLSRVPRIQVHCSNRVPRMQVYCYNRVPRIQVHCYNRVPRIQVYYEQGPQNTGVL